MADKTTLQKCVPFLEKHGMPKELYYAATTDEWLLDGVRDWMEISDKLAIIIIKEHLWEIIQGEAVEVNRNADCSCSPCYRIDVVLNNGVKFTRECPDDELALLLSAAEEAMK